MRASSKESNRKAGRACFLVLLVLPLASCDQVGGFGYESKIDQFTGQTISKASQTIPSGATKNVDAHLEISCAREKDEEGNPANDPALDIIIVDDKGNGLNYNDLSIKFDQMTPWTFDQLRGLDESKHSNEFQANFTILWMENFVSMGTLLANIAEHGDEKDFDRIIGSEYTDGFNKIPQTLSVRYETVGGIINDAVFDLRDNAVRHVLKDCGWLRGGAKQNVSSTPRNSAPAPQSPTNAPAADSSAPPSASLPVPAPPVTIPPTPTTSAAMQAEPQATQAKASISGGREFSAHLVGLDPNGDNYLSFRSGPGGTPYAELARLGPETHLSVLRSQGKWLFVRLDDGRQGWVFGQYVQADR